jgi:hypothetical protein
VRELLNRKQKPPFEWYMYCDHPPGGAHVSGNFARSLAERL